MVHIRAVARGQAPPKIDGATMHDLHQILGTRARRFNLMDRWQGLIENDYSPVPIKPKTKRPLRPLSERRPLSGRSWFRIPSVASATDAAGRPSPFPGCCVRAGGLAYNP
jgi:hypothetical protein